MSIINQTLRDLDARKADSEAPPAPARPVPALSLPSSRRGVWIALALLLPIAGLAIWFGLKSPRVTELAPEEATSIVAAIPVVSEPAPAVLPEAVPVTLPLQAAGSAQPKTVDTPSRPVMEKLVVKARPAEAPLPLRPTAELLQGTTSAEQVPQGVQVPSTLKATAISKEVRKSAPEEDAEDRYRKALSLVNKGRENQARPLLEEAVKLFPGHVAARQVLATLLNEAGMNREAEAVLREGRIVSPDNAWFALSLARIQMAQGDHEGAAATMRDGIEGRGVNADYRATYAALLSRLKRHAEAAQQYELALRQQPDQGTWWMGLGLALSVQGKSSEARAAYGRALSAGNLSEKLEDFVRAKLAE